MGAPDANFGFSCAALWVEELQTQHLGPMSANSEISST